MIIIDPVALGDVAFTRASPGTYFDRDGVMRAAAENVPRVTYDPSNLSKAPWALVEPEAVNYFRSSDSLNGAWSINGGDVSSGGVPSPRGDTTASRWSLSGAGNGRYQVVAGAASEIGVTYTASIYCRYVSGAGRMYLAVEGQASAYFDIQNGTAASPTPGLLYDIERYENGWMRIWISFTATGSSRAIVFYKEDNTPLVFDVFGSQLERGQRPSSYIAAGASVGSRAADIVGIGAGVVYSNVPIAEPNYDATATYAKAVRVHDPATHNVFESLIDANKGKALTDTTAWTPRGATNRWAMLDQYNNTQTTAQDEILLVVSPKTISRGFYIGNVDATEVRISVTDLYKGVVYQETQSLRLSTSASSFYNWCFNRIRRRSWAVSLGLPPYYGSLVTISISKPGGTVACGMCVVGPTMDLGKTLMGLGAEIKDFSETSFNFDGTSTTKRRNWAKRITADISVDSDQVEAVYEELARLRQKPLVWVGSPKFGLSIAFARYSAIKPVIKGATRWEMSAQLEGTV